MKYLTLEWLEPERDEPSRIYTEMDDDRTELRRIEQYPDGLCEAYPTGSKGLRTEPYPEDLRELEGSPAVMPLNQIQFEFLWKQTQEVGASFTGMFF